MGRLASVLLVVLIASVLGLGVVLVRDGDRAHDDAERQACLTRVQTTAAVAMLTPESRVDDEGRLEAVTVLSTRLDDC